MSLRIDLIPRQEVIRLWNAPLDEFQRLALVADACRANALAAVKLAGSGHLGSSFSAMDLVASLYFKEMNTAQTGWDSQERDIYFSSKGHDVPGLYAVLYALGAIEEKSLLGLRRLGNLDGHPDVGVNGVEANSGSLGMGISKGRGMAWAKQAAGRGGRVYVLTGDGELQEGQIYESLQGASQQNPKNLVVMVDHNKVQSDKLVDEIVTLGDLEAKIKSFGWRVLRINGHDFKAIAQALADCRSQSGPAIIIADTIKGRGVSFMEHPQALADSGGLYPWHAGAPDDDSFARAHGELLSRINQALAQAGLDLLETKDVTPPPKQSSGVSNERVAESFGQTLVELAPEHPELVVLDADLAVDCRIRTFEETYPERFIECGIAEQDMVSMAGGLARQGFLPVVNSFACFLASRANEQIYNNATEKSKIIYALHFGGLIPAGPGKSHQSLRDISLLGALPNMTIIQPMNAEETRAALKWAVEEAEENVALRLVIGPSPRIIETPAGYNFAPGRGAVLTPGEDAVIFAYGPVMLHEALVAAENLAERGIGLKVINLPWLNRIDMDWLAGQIPAQAPLSVLEDHAAMGGLGDRLLQWLVDGDLLAGRHLNRLAPEGYPACGNPKEVLRFHGLDGESLASTITDQLG